MERKTLKVALDKAVTDGELLELERVLDEIARDVVASFGALVLRRLQDVGEGYIEPRQLSVIFEEALNDFGKKQENG